MDEKLPELDTKAKITFGIDKLHQSREPLRQLLTNNETDFKEKVRQVTEFLMTFFRTMELFKSEVGYTLEDAEDGKITKVSSETHEELIKNLNFIKDELFPFVKKEPEHGEPIDVNVLKMMEDKVVEADILISGLK